MNVYDYDNYKVFINDWVACQPRQGYGQYKRLADYLNINSVVISQVFSGNRHISLEHACEISSYVGLKKSEENYFLALVEYARAGSERLKQVLKDRIDKERSSANQLSKRIKHKAFTEKERNQFYSSWVFSAARLASSIPSINTIDDLASYLNIDRTAVTKVFRYLIESGLIVEEDGKTDLGPKITHVPRDSIFVKRHHINWRTQALSRLDTDLTGKELFYTGPMVLSEDGASKILSNLIADIEKFTEIAKNSKSETLRCLNIDWFIPRG